MKLTYNGTVIAAEGDFGGFDSIEGFDLPDDPFIDWAQYTDAEYQVPIPRGQRKLVMTGTIRPAPAASLAARLLIMEGILATLPDQGDFVKQVGGVTSTYAGAVRGPFKPLKNMAGVGYGYELTFAVSAPPTVTGAP